MIPLRQTMIQAMCQHGFPPPPRTQHSYLYGVCQHQFKSDPLIGVGGAADCPDHFKWSQGKPCLQFFWPCQTSFWAGSGNAIQIDA